MGNQGRQYYSPRRERDALQTRQDILRVAKSQFISQGYSRTTVPEIARSAGVAVKTVYVSVGGKSDILHALLTADVADSAAPQTLQEVRASPDLDTAIRAIGHGTRHNTERFAESIELLLASRSADEGARATWEHILEEYRSALRDAAEELIAGGHVSADVDINKAADHLWFYFGLGAWRSLTVECGWDYGPAERWLVSRAAEALKAA